MPRARKEDEVTIDVGEEHEAPDVEIVEDAELVSDDTDTERADNEGMNFHLQTEQQMIREANTDFVKAQASFGNVAKDSKGNYGKFLSLPKLLDAVRKGLNENNLFLTQATGKRNDEDVVFTEVTHVNGLVVAESVYPVQTADRTNPQKMGSGLTYARRYALMSLVGIGAEDDEGELAAKPATPRQQAAKPQVLRKLSEMGVKTSEQFKQLASDAGIKANSSQELTEEQSALWLAKLNGGNGAGTPF